MYHALLTLHACAEIHTDAQMKAVVKEKAPRVCMS